LEIHPFFIFTDSDKTTLLLNIRKELVGIERKSLCEMMAYANPPETVKVTFGLYLNYYLDEEKT